MTDLETLLKEIESRIERIMDSESKTCALEAVTLNDVPRLISVVRLLVEAIDDSLCNLCTEEEEYLSKELREIESWLSEALIRAKDILRGGADDPK